jgi:hypothetical protein
MTDDARGRVASPLKLGTKKIGGGIRPLILLGLSVMNPLGGIRISSSLAFSLLLDCLTSTVKSTLGTGLCIWVTSRSRSRPRSRALQDPSHWASLSGPGMGRSTFERPFLFPPFRDLFPCIFDQSARTSNLGSVSRPGQRHSRCSCSCRRRANALTLLGTQHLLGKRENKILQT